MLVQMEINKGIISHTVVAFGVTSSRLAYLEYYLYSGLICQVLHVNDSILFSI